MAEDDLLRQAHDESNARLESHEESGRPPIDAPPTEHRRWFTDKINEYVRQLTEITRIGMDYDDVRDGNELTRATENLVRIREQMADAYMDGNKAERQTLTFADNEFVVTDDHQFGVSIQRKDDGLYELLVSHDISTVPLRITRLPISAFYIEKTLLKELL